VAALREMSSERHLFLRRLGCVRSHHVTVFSFCQSLLLAKREKMTYALVHASRIDCAY
jgi:hypothetical protein